jgi:hypothetical protein
MPTYTTLPRFDRDYAQLLPEDQKRFKQAVRKFIEDLERGEGFRAGLRVRGIQGAPGVFEMTWAPNGRATFEYGDPIQKDQTHVRWRRVGTHTVLDTP